MKRERREDTTPRMQKKNIKPRKRSFVIHLLFRSSFLSFFLNFQASRHFLDRWLWPSNVCVSIYLRRLSICLSIEPISNPSIDRKNQSLTLHLVFFLVFYELTHAFTVSRLISLSSLLLPLLPSLPFLLPSLCLVLSNTHRCSEGQESDPVRKNTRETKDQEKERLTEQVYIHQKHDDTSQ